MGDSNNTPQQVVGGNRSKTEIARFTSTTTWTCPQNVTNVDVWVCGGGGGGASGEWGNSADLYGRCGSGGCGGECIMYRNINVTPNQSYNIVIGVGGAGGVKAASAGSMGSKGSNGGQSYFIDTTYSAKGGDGGNNYGSVDDDYTGTGKGGDGAYSARQGKSFTASNVETYIGLPGGYDRMAFPCIRQVPISGTFGSNGILSNASYSIVLSPYFSFESDSINKAGSTFLNGLNPYDGYYYGIGGTGASNHYLSSRTNTFAPYLATWSGNMHGGYSRKDLYTNNNSKNVDGSVTCGGGGSTGGNLDNYPHAGGNGGSGLIIIYG